jgi:hypothetical protein
LGRALGLVHRGISQGWEEASKRGSGGSGGGGGARRAGGWPA